MTSFVHKMDQFEKGAIVSLQSILNARERVAEEKFDRFAFFINKLPPHRALMVFGHVLNAVADRMPDEDPHKLSLKRMGRTVTKEMGEDFVKIAETDPDFYNKNRDAMAKSLCDMSDLMRKIAEEKRA